MSIIIRLQNLPWSANSLDIRRYFTGLSIPEGGVHIVGGEMGDAFIAFSTDEDARLAMAKDGGKIKDMQIKLLLSSRTEMMRVIEQARQQNVVSQPILPPPTIIPSNTIIPPLPPPAPIQQPRTTAPDSDSRRRTRSPASHGRSRDRSPGRDRRRSPDDRRSSKRDRSRSRSPSRSSHHSSRDRERRSDRSKRDDRRHDDSRYRDDRRSSRDNSGETKKYTDADHVNSRSQLHEGHRDTQQVYDQTQNISSNTYQYSNQQQHAPVKKFVDPFSLPPDSSIQLSKTELIGSQKPFDAASLGELKHSALPPVSTIYNQPASYQMHAIQPPGPSIKERSVSDEGDAKPHRRLRFESDFGPPASSTPFSAESNIKIQNIQDQQNPPSYNLERSTQDDFHKNVNTWSQGMTSRIENVAWNEKNKTPTMSSSGDFIQVVPMDLDPPCELSGEINTFSESAMSSRGPFSYSTANEPPRNDDLRQNQQNRGGILMQNDNRIPGIDPNIQNSGMAYSRMPFNSNMQNRGLERVHDIQKRPPLQIDNQNPDPLMQVQHSQKRDLSMHVDGQNRSHIMHDEIHNRDSMPSEIQSRVQPMHNTNQNRGPIIYDEAQNRSLPMHNENRVHSVYGNTQNRGLLDHVDNQNRRPTLHADSQRMPPEHGDNQNRGPQVLSDRRPPMHGDSYRDSQVDNQTRGPLLHGDVQNRGPPMYVENQNRAIVHDDIQNRHLPLHIDSQRGPPVPSDMQNRGPPLHSDIQNRGPSLHGDIQNRGPSLHSNVQNRGPLLHGDIQNRGPSFHGDIQGGRGPALHGDIQIRGPPSHDKQIRFPLMHGDNQNRGPAIQGAPTHGNSQRGPPVHSDSHNRGPLMRGDSHNSGPPLHGDSYNRGSPMYGDSQNRRPPMHGDSQNIRPPMHDDSHNRGPPMHGDNRNKGPLIHHSMHGDNLNRGPPMHENSHNRGPPLHGDIQSRGSSFHGDIQNRGPALHGDIQNRGPPLHDNKQTMHEDSGNRGLPMQVDNRNRGPLIHSDNHNRGFAVHGDNLNRGRPIQADNLNRGPPIHGDNHNRGPLIQGDSHNRGFSMFSDNKNQGPLIHDSQKRDLPMHDDNQKRRLPVDDNNQKRRLPVEDDNQKKGPLIQDEKQKRLPPIHDNNQNKEPLIRNDNHSRSLPLQKESQSKGPSTLTVEVLGLPSDTKIEGVLELFRGISLPTANIRLKFNDQGIEKALIRFSSSADFEEALSRNHCFKQERKCELVPCSAAAFDNIPQKQELKSKTRSREEDLTVQLKGLPFSCKEDDIVKFFDGLPILDLFIEYGSDGRATGIGFVVFRSIKDFRIALAMSGKMINHRYVTISVASKELMILAKNKNVLPTDSNVNPTASSNIQSSQPLLNQSKPVPPTQDIPVQPPNQNRLVQLPNQDRPLQPSNSDILLQPPNQDKSSQPPNQDRPIQPLNQDRPIQPPNQDRPIQPPIQDRPVQHLNKDRSLQPPNQGGPAPPLNRIRPLGPEVRQPPFCIFMKGLPEGVTNRDIADFLHQVNITPRAIHIMLRPDKMPSGDAYAEFPNPTDMEAALTMSGKLMRDNEVHIEPISFFKMSNILGRPTAPILAPASGGLLQPPDMERPRRPLHEGPDASYRERPHMDHSMRGERPFRPYGRPPFAPGQMRGPWPRGPRQESRFPPPPVDNGPKDFGSPGCVVSINNLHFRAGLEELLEFFNGYDITKDNIIRRYNEHGQTTGEARVAFQNPRDAQKVVRELNQRPIMGRPLTLSLV